MGGRLSLFTFLYLLGFQVHDVLPILKDFKNKIYIFASSVLEDVVPFTGMERLRKK